MNDDASVELLESLIKQYKDRLRNGENPSILEYARNNPHLYTEIVEIFPSIESMENLKRFREDAAQASPRSDLPFARLGEYRIIRELGRGGMGIVYEAFQESLNRSVAIKVLPWLTNADETALKRFNREARVAAGLEHPNIIPIFGFGVQDDIHYFTMRYIRGAGLEELIRHLGRQGLAGDNCAFAPSRKNLLQETIAGIIKTNASRSGPRGKTTAQTIVPLVTHPATNDVRQIQQGLPPVFYREIAALISQVASALHYAHSQGALHRDIKPANLLVDTLSGDNMADRLRHSKNAGVGHADQIEK
jgi:serine/threonine protein kinase